MMEMFTLGAQVVKLTAGCWKCLAYYIRTKAVNVNETEIFKAIEATYGNGILWAFADLLERDKDMKTFETEKHNMPEGATHYHNENDDYEFCWFKIVNGEWFAYCPKEVVEGWTKCIDEHERDGFEAIPAETPEGKEALCEKTYRYEKVTDSIFDLKEEFERGELYFAWLGNHEPGSNSVGYDQITDEKMLLCRYEEKRLLRRIEVTERELFIELVERVGSELMDNGEWSFACLATSILDSEEFNITKGKG